MEMPASQTAEVPQTFLFPLQCIVCLVSVVASLGETRTDLTESVKAEIVMKRIKKKIARANKEPKEPKGRGGLLSFKLFANILQCTIHFPCENNHIVFLSIYLSIYNIMYHVV